MLRSALPSRVDAAAVFLGGTLGTAARWGLIEWIGVPGGFPWATLAANLAGAALLGWLSGLARRFAERGVLWSLLGVGFAGALTTFSTLVLESVDIADAQGVAAAAWYTGLSVLAGIALADRARTWGAP